MRALNVGDQEDIAMIRLAKVCEKLHDEEGTLFSIISSCDLVIKIKTYRFFHNQLRFTTTLIS